MKNMTDGFIGRRRGGRGFSLIELLVTMSIMGVLAALAMTKYGNSRDAAEDQKDKRNAQQIATIAAMANAAGAKFLVPEDKKASIEKLCEGCSPAQGAFKGRVFRVGDLEEPEILGAMRYLALNGAELQYRLTGAE